MNIKFYFYLFYYFKIFYFYYYFSNYKWTKKIQKKIM